MLKLYIKLSGALSKVSRIGQSQRSEEKRKLLASMVDLDKKSCTELRSKSGDCNKIYVTKINKIAF